MKVSRLPGAWPEPFNNGVLSIYSGGVVGEVGQAAAIKVDSIPGEAVVEKQ